jgi:hypothetical protein
MAETEKPDPTQEEEKDEKDDEPQLTRGQQALRMAIMTLVLLVLVELGARIAFYVHRKNIDEAAALDYPPHTYLGDFAAKVDYRFINFYTIDPNRANNEEYQFDRYGFRLDARDLRFDQPMKWKKIWVFGGSTMQGLGARRDETIAAHLNKLLESTGSEYRAINMGQGGFTSTQELLLLIELLQQGHKPDLIVSYDGATEVPFPGDITKTGTPEWEMRDPKGQLMLDIQGDESIGTLLPLTLARLVRVDDVMRSLARRSKGAQQATYDAENWGEVARKYLTTLNLIKSAADAQKTTSVFFFQPILAYEVHYDLRKIAPEEEKLKAKMIPNEHKRFETVFSEDSAPLRGGLGGRFFDLHDVFKGHDGEKLYNDARHPSGAGNALIAARIHEELKKLDVLR